MASSTLAVMRMLLWRRSVHFVMAQRLRPPADFIAGARLRRGMT
jgi:hypothetical protein